MEPQHKRGHRDEGADGEDHRPAHGGVVAEAEDHPVVDERQRRQGLGERGAQQRGDRGAAHRGVGGEHLRCAEREHGGHRGQPAAGRYPQDECAPRRHLGRRVVVDAKGRADVDLRGHREGVGGQRQQSPQPVGDLPPGERNRAEPRGDRGSGQRYHAERDRPHREPVPVAQHGGDVPPVRPYRRARRAARCHAVRRRGEHLRCDRAPGRADEPGVQPEDQPRLKRAVHDVGADRYAQRRPGVLQAGLQAVARIGQVKEGQPERGDPDVAGCRGRNAAPGPEHGDQDRGDGGDDAGGHHAPDGGDRVGGADGASRRKGLTPRGAARYLGGGGGGQEDGEPGDDRQRGGGDRERVERRATEMADDRGVDQVVQWLRCDRAEGRDGQPGDPPVKIASALVHAARIYVAA